MRVYCLLHAGVDWRLEQLREYDVGDAFGSSHPSVHAGMTSVAQLQNGLANGLPALPGLPATQPGSAAAAGQAEPEAGAASSPTSGLMNGSVPAKKVAHTALRPSVSHSVPAKRGPGRPPKKP